MPDTFINNRVTALDVAKLAGVDRSTVSRVINDSSLVAPATRKRVLDSIRKTGYRPSSAAAALVRKKHHTIGLVNHTESSQVYYGASLVHAVSVEAADRGYRVAIGTAPWNSDATGVLDLRLLRSHSVDGVIVDCHMLRGDLDALASRLNMPCVFVNPPGGWRSSNAVVVDDIGVGRMAAEYLADRGHRNVGYIPCLECADKPAHASQRDRLRGFCDVVAERGMKLMPHSMEPPIPLGGPESSVVSRLKHWVENEGCTAVCGYDGTLTLRGIQAGLMLGYRMPQNLEFVACDYDPAISSLLEPIAFVRVGRDRMGRVAVEMLQDMIESGDWSSETRVCRGEFFDVNVWEDGALDLGTFDEHRD